VSGKWLAGWQGSAACCASCPCPSSRAPFWLRTWPGCMASWPGSPGLVLTLAPAASLPW